MTPNPTVLCPACESGELRPGPVLVRCSACEYALSRDLYLALRRIRALPEAEPVRPGTRRLTGGVLESPPRAGEGTQRKASKKP